MKIILYHTTFPAFIFNDHKNPLRSRRKYLNLLPRVIICMSLYLLLWKNNEMNIETWIEPTFISQNTFRTKGKIIYKLYYTWLSPGMS